MATTASVDVEAFDEYLIGLGFSPNTRRNYRMRFKQAARWADEADVDLLAMSAKQAAWLGETLPRSHTAQRQLRSMLGHLWDMHEVYGPYKAIRVPPRPRSRWRGLEDDQVLRLLEVARDDWPRGGVILLGLYLGLRREEIASLRWADFDDDLTWVRIQGKGDRIRHLPVHDQLVEALRAVRWPGEYVFPGRFPRNPHISTATINKWVAELGGLAGLEGLHPHQLRHTAGGKVNDETRDIHMAQEFLGHAQVETTLTYTRVTRERLRSAVATFDGWTDPPDSGSKVVELRRAR